MSQEFIFFRVSIVVLLLIPGLVLAADEPQVVVQANGYGGSINTAYKERVEVSWNSINVVECRKIVTDTTNNRIIEQSFVSSNMNGVAGIRPELSLMYKIKCRNVNGSVVQDSVRINVRMPDPKVDIKVNGLDENRPGSGAVIVPIGSIARVSWTSENAVRCSGIGVKEDGTEVNLGNIPLKGSSSVRIPTRRGFIFKCVNADGVEAKDIARVLVAKVADKKTCVALQSSPRLGFGSGEVTLLQKFLFENGYLAVSPTGYFGSATTEAVKNFQKSVGLRADGLIDSNTRTKITEISCR